LGPHQVVVSRQGLAQRHLHLLRADVPRVGQIAVDAVLLHDIVKDQGVLQAVPGEEGIEEDDPLELSRLFGIAPGALDGFAVDELHRRLLRR